MRIGLDISHVQMGCPYGIARYTANLVSHLSRIDHGNQYYLLSSTRRPVPDFGRLGSNIIRVDAFSPRFGRLSWPIYTQCILPFYIKRLKLDIFHSMGIVASPEMPGVPYSPLVPMVVTIHDLIPLIYRRQLLSTLQRRSYYYFLLGAAKRAKQIITDSETSKNDITSMLRIPPHKIAVIPLAVDDAIVEPRTNVALPFKLPRDYILHVSNREITKNSSNLLRAYLQVRKAGKSHGLLIVGSGWQINEIRKECGEYWRDVNVVSNLPDAYLHYVYLRASAFVFPSFYEGFGLPPLEAMSCGVPVIASKTSSLPEILGDAAVFVDPFRADDISDGILRVLDNPRLSQEYAEKGRVQARNYSWTRTAKMTLDVYRETCAKA